MLTANPPMHQILFEQTGPIGKLTLNNPQELNAMTPEMGEAIKNIVPEINKKKDLRVLLITGTGRAFSAGGNLDFILAHTQKSLEENKIDMKEFYSKFLSLRNIEVPTIAVLNGPAIGAGFLVALACDLRYAVKNAKLAVNFAKLGLSSGMGGLYSLTKLVGPAIAAELLFTGKLFTAEQAYEWKLVNGVFATEELNSKVQEVAELIARNAPISLKIMKLGVQRAVTGSLEELIEYEAVGQAKTFATKDLLEGIEAIRGKREPRFGGE
jgi:enoyl-CoA hydratase